MKLKPYLAPIAFGQAVIAMLGSLYFSELANLAPCILCWYQRVAMYPLVAILAVGILRDDKKVYEYALPLSIIGTGIAFYQNLLYYHVIPEAIAPCRLGVSCTTRYIDWLGFITIPLLSLAAFVLITVCMLLLRHEAKKSI